MNWRAYVRMARFDHWVKNLFVLPGIVVALAMDRQRVATLDWVTVVLGLVAVGFVSSSNYTLNEILDAPFDRLHPLKCHRPAAAREISVPWAWVEWLLLFAAGELLGLFISGKLALCLAALWIMGLAYNVPPIRLKDIPFVDVLAESVNSPIRFLAGWYLTGTQALPVTSVLVSYWMAGAYLMALKRYAEIRDIRSRETLVQYRKGFRYATEQRLLASIVFYGSLAMLFFGAFMGRYRLEMALSFPLVAMVMATYMALTFKPDSAAQRPEGLLREPWLMAGVVACAAAVGVLLFADLPWLHEVFQPTRP
jgi:4-hydroxybenzoate polyprenyltransferase